MVIRQRPGHPAFTLIVTIPPETAPDGLGEVAIELEDGHRISIPLLPSHFRVLRILVKAAIEDEASMMDIKGARTTDAIHRLYLEQTGEIAPKDVKLMTQYVSKIRRKLEDAIEELVLEGKLDRVILLPSAIEFVKGRGYRLGAFSLVFIDYSAPEKPLV